MHNHAPDDYVCPICLAINGVENDETWIKQADIVYRDDLVVAFIGSKFIAGNEGYPLVVPRKHFENLYELPEEDAHHIMHVAQRIAVVLKGVRHCEGVTILQNNEPAGDQHAFHYHMHVIPRFTNDRFHEELFRTRRSEPEERLKFAEQLRSALL